MNTGAQGVTYTTVTCGLYEKEGERSLNCLLITRVTTAASIDTNFVGNFSHAQSFGSQTTVGTMQRGSEGTCSPEKSCHTAPMLT